MKDEIKVEFYFKIIFCHLFIQAGIILSPDVANIVLEDDDYSSAFVSWVASHCLNLSQKKNRLALYNSLILKAGGASQSALAFAKTTQG